MDQLYNIFDLSQGFRKLKFDYFYIHTQKGKQNRFQIYK